MKEVVHVGTPLLYVGFSVLVVLLLAIAFVLLRKEGAHKVSVKKFLAFTGVKMFLFTGKRSDMGENTLLRWPASLVIRPKTA